MSTFNEIDIACEECGEEFKGIVWTAVHAEQDPELKDLLLGGELNILMCPKCSHAAYQDRFVLYQDPAAELVAYIYPPAQEQEADFLRKTMMSSFAEAQALYQPKDRKDYDPLLVFGLKAFVETMEEEALRAAQSQIAEVICRKQNIPFVILRPSRARALKITRVLPSGTSTQDPSRADILAGLDHLLAQNPSLDLYAALRVSIQQNSQWRCY